MTQCSENLKPSDTTNFADVAHQMLSFDRTQESEQLVLDLIDTRWVQRLRSIRQTGNTNLVYMFSEHSRFGHSLGVAFLATTLMHHLNRRHPDQIAPFQNAVAAAALLHDIGHIAPGSHLAEKVWNYKSSDKHEELTLRIIEEDEEIRSILDRYDANLASQVYGILSSSSELPPWTIAIISGSGWNADRGNWAIVDSAMCSVSYGRYNVAALIDAFRLDDQNQLVLQENRLDALTHFFLARDSMYRQVYQHRVLQSADRLTELVIKRLRDIIIQRDTPQKALDSAGAFYDPTMLKTLTTSNYAHNLELSTVFGMTEHWWNYHLWQWCDAQDSILQDLASRLRDRRLFKTIRLESANGSDGTSVEQRNAKLIAEAKDIAISCGFDPDYYVVIINSRDKHRSKLEDSPLALLDNGSVVRVADTEPLVNTLLKNTGNNRAWLAVPKEVKEKLGRIR